MTFVPVAGSGARRWIIGVGGYDKARDWETILLDADNPSGSFTTGPKLAAAKCCLLVVSAGDRVYALACHPEARREPDSPPWFEVLDLKGITAQHEARDLAWRPLPRPPCFPWRLTPRQLHAPSSLYQRRSSVRSYAVVGSHLLVSVNEAVGTHAFDMEAEEWRQVDGNSLPFTGAAVPHGPLGLFLAVSVRNHAITVTAYHIELVTTNRRASSPATASALSIAEYPVRMAPAPTKATGGGVGDVFVASLGDGHFCTLRYSTNVPVSSGGEYYCYSTLTDEVTVTLRTYWMEEALPAAGSGEVVAQQRAEQVFDVCGSSGCLDDPYFAGAFSI